MVIKLTRDDLAIFILEVVKNDNYTHQMQFISNENKNMLITSASGIIGKAMIKGFAPFLKVMKRTTAPKWFSCWYKGPIVSRLSHTTNWKPETKTY